MSVSNDAFYNRVCDIREGYPVWKRREQLAADIYHDVLTPTQNGCALLFERIGLLRSVEVVDRDILKALLASPSIFAALGDYQVTAQCAKAFIQLQMTPELETLAHKAPGGLAFWRQFVKRSETDISFSYGVREPCSLTFAPRRHLTRVRVHDPVELSAPNVGVAAFLVNLYASNHESVCFIARIDDGGPWWRVGVGIATPAVAIKYLLIAMAAYAYPSGPWPLADLPLSGETLSEFRANYLSKRRHFAALKTELEIQDQVVTNTRSSLLHVDAHTLTKAVHAETARLRNVLVESIEKIGALQTQLELDCTRVFARVWADARATIVAVQQSALGVCGEALPLHVVLDLLKLTQDGVTVLVTNEVRLIAMIEACTKRVCAIRERALDRRNKRKFDAVSEGDE